MLPRAAFVAGLVGVLAACGASSTPGASRTGPYEHGEAKPKAFPGGPCVPDPPSTRPFDREAAAAALAPRDFRACTTPDTPSGSGHVRVTFAPDGCPTVAFADQPPYEGTAFGACVANLFRRVHVPSFEGRPITVGVTFHVDGATRRP